MANEMAVQVWHCDEEHRASGCGLVAFFSADINEKKIRRCPQCSKKGCFARVADAVLEIKTGG